MVRDSRRDIVRGVRRRLPVHLGDGTVSHPDRRAPAPGNNPVSQSLPAGQTKAVLDSFVDAMIEWQYSFEPIYDDIYDETLALERFGDRTEAARARLHTSLAAMKAAIPADIDPALGDILNELVGAFTDKTTGIDDLADAAKASDRAASGVALDKWGPGSNASSLPSHDSLRRLGRI